MPGLAPVVEVAGKNQWLGRRDALMNMAHQVRDLLFALALEQTQMHADQVQVDAVFAVGSGVTDGPVQETALREAQHRGVDVVPAHEWELAEDGVAVVTVLIDRILAIGVVCPDGVGEVLQLGLRRPARHLFLVFAVGAHHLLQKHNVGSTVAQALADLAEYQSLRPEGETLVDIETEDSELLIEHGVSAGLRNDCWV